MNRLLPLLAVAVALLAAAGPARAQDARRVPDLFYGANWDADFQKTTTDDIRDAQNAKMAQSGVEGVRTAFEWALAQPKKGMPFDFTATDDLVANAVAHGIDVLPVVILAPKWARRYENVPHSPPRYVGDYDRYVRALVQRYGPDGTFWLTHPTLPKRPIRAWQIWNEPHLQYQWSIPTGMDYAPGYGALLRGAYRAVKAVDPGATVVLAGLSNESWKYLDHLYARGKVRGFFDVAALHPYTSKPKGVITLLRRYRSVLNRHGDGALPIWITELGLPASKGKLKGNDNKLQTTEAGMAQWLRGSYRLLADQWQRSWGAKRVYWYTWASMYCCEQFRYTGLLRWDPYGKTFEEKPALAAYVESARRDEGCEKDAHAACVAPAQPAGP